MSKHLQADKGLNCSVCDIFKINDWLPRSIQVGLTQDLQGVYQYIPIYIHILVYIMDKYLVGVTTKQKNVNSSEYLSLVSSIYVCI